MLALASSVTLGHDLVVTIGFPYSVLDAFVDQGDNVFVKKYHIQLIDFVSRYGC